MGTRLVEMLVERGATRVISFDVVPPPPDDTTWDHPNIEWRVGDITDIRAVDDLLSTPNIGCVWHNAAAVGQNEALMMMRHELFKQITHLATMSAA